MGRNLGSSCKLCRREGMKLFLKGIRCETSKCAVERRQKSLAPGMHGWRRGRGTDYGIRLREKQKVKRYYGVGEAQFMQYFERAEHTIGNTGEVLLGLLERRLDNVIYKLNFAPSRKAARQVIAHGHVFINGKKTDVPSFMVGIGDKITLKKNEKSKNRVKAQLDSNPNFSAQGWLQLDVKEPSATIVALPSRQDVQLAIEEQLVIEFCSR
ncbi:MAG: 30S ribosomal protein S4 [Planctomycetes bacterium GWF2_41_51]|nr:MAG: 30S ribosomal protein S4 [Planctomycetes bacterium GWF2_41_51]HBG27746.1 30S ribosomal protein S4 [Phycisphaerales bacterium]